MNVAVFIPTYQARNHVLGVLESLPAAFGRACAEVFVLDNASRDGTVEALQRGLSRGWPFPVNVYRNRTNLGYGGTQKVAYALCLRKGYDAVVMLHGDGQYPAALVPPLVDALGRASAGLAFGARFRGAGNDRTPLLRRWGVAALSGLQNLASGLHLSEWYSGFRAYSCAALRQVPFAWCDDDYYFDVQMILLLRLAGYRIAETPAPKLYDEVNRSHLNIYRFGRTVLARVLHYPLARGGVMPGGLYDPRKWATMTLPDMPAPELVFEGRAPAGPVHHAVAG
jgi:glycosyltransferase involved in cell wall biosynthesis